MSGVGYVSLCGPTAGRPRLFTIYQKKKSPWKYGNLWYPLGSLGEGAEWHFPFPVWVHRLASEVDRVMGKITDECGHKPIFEALEPRLLLSGTSPADGVISPDLGVANASAVAKKRVIIDMDPSITTAEPSLVDQLLDRTGSLTNGNVLPCDPDDILALIYAAQSEKWQVEGVTVGWGNMWDLFKPGIGIEPVRPVHQYWEAATKWVRELQELNLLEDSVGVYDGAGWEATWSEMDISPVDAHTGSLSREPETSNASDYIANTVMQNPGQITVIAQGTMTNLATAMYHYEGGPAQFLNDVDSIWVIGGGFPSLIPIRLGGNVPSTAFTAEYNIWRDPNAAEYVFSSVGHDGKINMVPLNATMDMTIGRSDWDEVLAGGTGLSSLVHEMVEGWVLVPLPPNGMYPFDTIGVAIALEADDLTTDYQVSDVQVLWPASATIGQHLGQTIALDNFGFPLPRPDRTDINIWHSFDIEAFRTRFIDRMIGPPTSQAPDYIVSNITPDGPVHPLPPLLTADSEFHVFVSTQNRGSQDAPGYPGTGPVSLTKVYLSLDDEITVDDICLGVQEVGPLAAGGPENDYVQVSLVGKGVQPGKYYIGAIADAPYDMHPIGIVDEGASEGNNTAIYLPFLTIQDEPVATLLSNGYVTPMTGVETTEYNYYVTYTHPQGESPKDVFMTPDEGPSLLMHEVSGNPTTGEVYTCSKEAFSPGVHDYFFTVRLQDGSMVSLSSDDPLPGPVVHAAGAMQITMLPEDDYEVGEEIRMNITIKDPDGNLYDPDGQYPIQVHETPSDYWYGSPVEVIRVDVGQYYFISRWTLAEGYTTFNCIVQSQEHKTTSVSCQLIGGDIPERDPVEISNISIDPPSINPGVTPVNITYDLSHEALVTIRIKDDTDATVRTLLDHGQRDPGANTAQWDGRDDDGQYVPDAQYSVVIEAINLQPLQSVGDYADWGTGFGQVRIPRGIWAHGDRIYAVDSDPRVPDTWKGLIFRKDTSLVGEFRNSAFMPLDIAVNSEGLIYTTSSPIYSTRIEVFDSDGNHLRSIGGVGTYLNRGPAITVDSEDNIYVGNGFNVYMLSSSETPLPGSGFPVGGSGMDEEITGIAVDMEGNIWVATFSSTIKKFDRNGNELFSFEGGFAGGSGISVRRDGLIFVKGRFGLYVFDSDGTPLHSHSLVSDERSSGVYADDAYVYATARTPGGAGELTTFSDLSSKDSKVCELIADSIPPTAIISAPANGGTVDAHATPTLSIMGTANDPAFSHYVIEWRDEAYPGLWWPLCNENVPVVDGQLATWDFAGISSGAYTLRLTVYDDTGTVTQTQVTVDYLDATAPSATILEPEGQATVSNLVRIEAESTDSDVLHVDLEYQPASGGIWQLMGTDWTRPYSLLWDTTALDSGDYLLRARASDTAGNTDESPATVAVSVDNTGPSAHIVAPGDGSAVTGETLLEADCTDADLAFVVFQYKKPEDTYWLPIGDVAAGDPLLVTWSTENLDSGAYELRALAVDAFWNIDEDPQVTVVYVAGVAARHVFYNNSAWDGNDPTAGIGDDGAIDADKHALRPDQTPTPANYTSYSRGINGIMIDIVGLDAEYTPVLGDFGIRINESPDTNTWINWPAASVDIRRGVGVDESDRVTLVWNDGEILNQWVEVTVLSDANDGNLGLGENDVFYLANLVGDADGDGQVGISDYETFVGEFGRSGDDLVTDLNGDGRADLYDFATLRGMYGNSVSVPTFPAAAPETPTAAPVATLQVATEPIAQVAAPMIPVIDQTLDDNNANDDSIATTALAPAIDLLAKSLSAVGYISGPQPISVGLPAATLQFAAAAGYDLRPLGDDLATNGQADDLLADILAESRLAVPL